MRYRKKPVVIEAIQTVIEMAHPGYADQAALEKLVGDGEFRIDVEGAVQVKTDSGWANGRVGDWLIRGTKGEIYLCKPDIFADIYEVA